MEDKEIAIKNIVAHLQIKFGFDKLVIRDYWEGDNCAIGLTNVDGKFIVYISTWKKKENEYFVSLENPSEIDSEGYTDAGDFDNVGIDKVEEIVSKHLCLKKLIIG